MPLRRVPPAVFGFVVSIHDVSPHTWDRVRRMREDLASWGVAAVSHLVVSDHHRRGFFADHPEFCAWIRDQVSAGDEAVVHGFYHERPRGGPGGLLERWITESYTAGEGEFFDLSETEASHRSGAARDAFRACGLNPTGFIAPAWLLGASAALGVKKAGFDYTTRLGTVDDWKAGISYGSQSLVYSVRAHWRRVVSLAWNETLALRLRFCPLIRLGLHPPDWDHPAIRNHARRCITQALAARDAMTYEQWLARQRAISIRA